MVLEMESPVKTVRVGLSEEEISFLQNYIDLGGTEVPRAGEQTSRRIKGAAQFLSRVVSCMEWRDLKTKKQFTKQDLEPALRARSLVLDTLFPFIYGCPMPKELTTDEKNELHSKLRLYSSILTQVGEGFNLEPQQMEQLPDVVNFFRAFGQKDYDGLSGEKSTSLF